MLSIKAFWREKFKLSEIGVLSKISRKFLNASKKTSKEQAKQSFLEKVNWVSALKGHRWYYYPTDLLHEDALVAPGLHRVPLELSAEHAFVHVAGPRHDDDIAGATRSWGRFYWPGKPMTEGGGM